jgi:hypothetical protein
MNTTDPKSPRTLKALSTASRYFRFYEPRRCDDVREIVQGDAIEPNQLVQILAIGPHMVLIEDQKSNRQYVARGACRRGLSVRVA